MSLTLFTDSFLTLTEADTQLSSYPEWLEASTATKEQVIKEATNRLNSQSWLSEAVDSVQPLAWPRLTFSFFDPVLNKEVQVTQGTLPARLKRATASLALFYCRFPAALSNYQVTYEKIKLGPLELEDTDKAGRSPPIPGEIDTLVAPLLSNSWLSPYSWWRAN